MIRQLTLLSLNVRGLRSPTAYRQLLTFLRSHPADIICLQETHSPSSPSAQSHYQRQWQGPVAWTPHLAVLLKPNHTLISSHSSHEGRLLEVTASLWGHELSFVNMYAPAVYTDRRVFFDSLSSSPFNSSQISFLLGDWNDFPDPLVDRCSSAAPSHRMWSHLQPALVSFFDAASVGAGRPYFTFSTNTSAGTYQALLDHIFASLAYHSSTFATSVIPFPLSDHDALCVTLTPSSFTPPLLWRLNTSLLPLPDLFSTTSSIFSSITLDTWDAGKIMARAAAQDQAVLAARNRKSLQRRLERQIAQAAHQARHTAAHSAPRLREQQLRRELKHHLEYQTGQAILRARVRWLESGETCSNYFFSRYRPRRKVATLDMVCDSSLHPFPSPSSRQQHITSFYTSLYATPPFSSTCDSFLSSLPIPHLSPFAIASLSAPITLDEISLGISILPAHKAPGIDGLPYEWYKSYSSFLLPSLLTLFNAILDGASPPDSWSRTLISLLPKPARDHREIRNWRPITLANCDAKIFSRILANRLALFLPDLVHPDQAGFTRGRNAADIAMSLRQVLDHASKHHIDGAILFLDQEKAYDRISHQYLSAVLSAFGMPDHLRRIFECTFAPAAAHIMDDGQPLPAVPIGCGVRQGDPLAPLLYNLALEPFLIALRTRLSGLTLPWGPYVLKAFADDTHVVLSPTDPPTFLQTLDSFQTASNSRINIDKSTLLALSDSSSAWTDALPFPCHNPAQPVRVLGYQLIRKAGGIQEDWNAFLTDFEPRALALTGRHCSLQGRVLLTNMLLLSRIWYKGRHSSPPPASSKALRKLCWNMVWGGHPTLAPS